jgi:RND family efflux transporter MFP subunit
VLAEEGDFVKEGQVLAELDDAQLQIRLRLAEERLAQAKIQLERSRIRQDKASALIRHNRAELTRFESAAKEGLASEKDVAAFKYKTEELDHDEKAAIFDTREFQHRISELEAEIAQNKLDISRAQIRAPFDGFITQRTINIGQRVRALEPIFNLGSFSPLFADVHISERDARAVQAKQTAAIRLGSDDNVSVQGRVERISPVVDQSSGTVKVTIALEPKHGFRPGAFVRVEIRTDTRVNAVLIPKRAIIEEDGQNYVYLAAGDRANRTKVTLGYQSEGLVEVRQGVNQGERVVVAGHGALKEGARIKVVATQNNAGQPTAAAKL